MRIDGVTPVKIVGSWKKPSACGPDVKRRQFVLNVLNLFDQSQTTDAFRVETRANLPIGTLENFFAGFDIQRQITTNNILRDPRFLQDSVWQAPREVRLGFKLMF